MSRAITTAWPMQDVKVQNNFVEALVQHRSSIFFLWQKNNVDLFMPPPFVCRFYWLRLFRG